MKKITAIALLSLFLVSCKKETKTITKTDPTTGKQITVEVPVEKSDEKEAEKKENPAIKDSLGVYYQTFKLETGKTYPLTTVQKDRQNMTAPDGKSVSGTSESVDEMTFTVNSLDKGIYDISVNLVAKKSAQSGNGKSIVVDTKLPMPKDEQLQSIWKVNKALIGNKLEMKLDGNGNVISIKGFEPIYTKIAASANGFIKDSKQKTAFLNSFKQTFSEKTIKEQFAKNLVLLPKKGAKIGGKWTSSEGEGNVKLVTTYTLKSVGNGVAEIAVSGGIPYKSDKKTQQQMTHSMSSELNQSGLIKIDENTGWVKNQNINVKTTQIETISDGKQTQSMKSVSTSNVVVNP